MGLQKLRASLPLWMTNFSVHRIIKRYAKKQDFFFIQVGSNDGRTGDPIHRYIDTYRWKGIFIEPIPFLFARLQENYHHDGRFIFENVAIDKENGTKTFYRVAQNDDPRNPWWYDQIGSFNKDVVLKHRNLIPSFDTHFVSEEIPCLSFASLIAKHKVAHIDLLHIDTEGYDYEIIKCVPFDAVRPTMILFEDKHLSADDMREAAAFLRKQGYMTIKMDKGNTFAYLA